MKNVKVNFALAMVIIIVIALAAVLCATGAAIISKTLDSTVEALDEERLSDDEIVSLYRELYALVNDKFLLIYSYLQAKIVYPFLFLNNLHRY